uniref:Uncharacterized protein n=1 Tax=Sus scrofa TaxID=9823 RepID=A0A8D0XIL3_PIG
QGTNISISATPGTYVATKQVKLLNATPLKPLLHLTINDKTDPWKTYTFSINNINSVITGSRILNLGVLLQHSGIFSFNYFLLFTAILAAYVVHILIRLCVQAAETEYKDVGDKAFNLPSKGVSSSTVTIKNMFSWQSFLNNLKTQIKAHIFFFIIGDHSPSIVREGETVQIILCKMVLFCLELCPKLKFLNYYFIVFFFFFFFFGIPIIISKWNIPSPIILNSIAKFYKIKNESDSCKPNAFHMLKKMKYSIPDTSF